VIRASRNSVDASAEEDEPSSNDEEEWPDVIGEAGDLPM
jgi:hypothetical protein